MCGDFTTSLEHDHIQTELGIHARRRKHDSSVRAGTLLDAEAVRPAAMARACFKLCGKRE
jgi:hypothetical protein